MSDSGARRILLVEDEDNLRELVRGRLEANGYEVAVAEDGYKALVLARDFHPDLVVLDLMLPKMDGYAVCRMLRSGADGESLPIILFSARSSSDDRRRGEEVGANAYVNKPFDPPVLLDKISELLDPEGWAARHAGDPAVGPKAGVEPETSLPAPPVVKEVPPQVVPHEPEVKVGEPSPASAEAAAAPMPDKAPADEKSVTRVDPSAGAGPTAGSGPVRGADEAGPTGFFARLFARIFGTRKG